MMRQRGYTLGFRFRKSIKLFPGLRLNLSKSGVSASVGVKGATVNISDRGTRGTVGIPGSGISYSENLSAPEHAARPEPTPSGGMSLGTVLGWVFVAVCFFVILSKVSG